MNPIISKCQNAKSIETHDSKAAVIVGQIRSGNWREQVEHIRSAYSRAVQAGRNGKVAAGELKLRLPAVMWSGCFSTRASNVELSDKLTAHSGLLCADLDDLSIEQLDDCRAKLTVDPHVWALFTSPTGTGLKVVFRVPASAEQHEASFRAVQAVVRKSCAVEIDQACSDVPRLCFVSYDPEAFSNRNATELPVESLPVKANATKAVASVDLNERQRIASALLGKVFWTNGERGYCECPGKARHTGENADRDCGVHLDGAPTIHCFHNSCRPVVEAMNRELRSQIGKVEASEHVIITKPPARGALPPTREEFADGPDLPRALTWPEPMHPAAFHGLAGDLVRAIEPHTEAANEAVLSMFLSAFGSMVGPAAHFMAEARQHPARVWPILVGETAKGRKGSAWSSLRFLLAQVDEDWCTNRVESGLSSGEGLIWAVRDPITRTKRNKDGEEELIIEDAGIDDKRLFCIEEEFSSVLKVSAREANIVSDILRRAWDMGNLRTLTKNSPARATEAHVTVVGHITKAELLKLLKQTDALNGFGNRFVWLAVRRSKLLPDGGTLHTAPLAPLISRLRKAVDHARAASQMPRTPSARDFWHAVYPALTGDRPGLLGSITNRAEAQVMRTALVYALLDQSRQIDVEHLRAALAFWDYCERSAAFIFGESLGDRVADRLAGELRCAGESGLTQTAIRDLFQRNESAASISEALAMLKRFGIARPEKASPTQKGGRPAIVWRYINDRDDQNDQTAPGSPVSSYRSFLTSVSFSKNAHAVREAEQETGEGQMVVPSAEEVEELYV